MSSHEAPPEDSGGYRRLRVLGTGGMGTVYAALDSAGQEVALKVLHPGIAADHQVRERLRREVATLHRVRGDHVARVIDAEVDAREAFIVTELIDGQTLDESVQQHGPLNVHELTELATGLATALQRIHEAGVVHRDLKPGNVMLTDTGPVLIDFGISQLLDDARITRTGLVTGTPGYVDPVVLTGASPDQLGDWWGWAGLLVFASTGRDPFGTGPAVLNRAEAGRVDLQGVPEPLARVLAAALNPNPQYRLPPAGVVEHLREVSEGRHMSIPPTATVASRTSVLPPRIPPGAIPPPAAHQGNRDSLVESWPDLPPTSREPVRGDVGHPSPYIAFPPPMPEVSPRPAPARPLLTAMAWLALVLVSVRWAGGMTIVITAFIVATGTWGWGERRLRARRAKRGVRGRDVTMAWIASPWHLGSAAITALPGVLAGAVLGLGIWLIASRYIEDGLAAAAAVAIFTFVAWFVPSSLSARVGTRRIWATVAPNAAARAAGTVLAVMVLVALGSWALRHTGEAAWSPFPMPRP